MNICKLGKFDLKNFAMPNLRFFKIFDAISSLEACHDFFWTNEMKINSQLRVR